MDEIFFAGNKEFLDIFTSADAKCKRRAIMLLLNHLYLSKGGIKAEKITFQIT